VFRPILTILALASANAEAASQKESWARLKGIFQPEIGSEVRFEATEVIDFGRKNPEKLRGYIAIKPPAGKCLLITRRPDIPDEKICKATTLTWTIEDVQPGGRIVWELRGDSTSAADVIDLEWTTPHRIAQTIPVGERRVELYRNVVVLDCKVSVSSHTRKIDLALADGRTWKIIFPPKDISIQTSKDEPNLYFQERIGFGGISDDSTLDMDRKYSFDATKARANSRKSESTTTYWAITDRGAFGMDAVNFVTSDGPMGSNGKCRYRTAQQLDPDPGYIECHHMADIDVVCTPLTCLPEVLNTSN